MNPSTLSTARHRTARGAGLLAAGVLAGTVAGAFAIGVGAVGGTGARAAHVTAMPPFCVVTAQSKGGPYDGLCVWVPGAPKAF